jgi:DNA-binding NarL/FixJ family response regulator
MSDDDLIVRLGRVGDGFRPSAHAEERVRRAVLEGAGLLDGSPGAPPTVGCVVVDDHAVVREGLRRVLAQTDDLHVLGDAGNGDDAVALVGRRRPDVVLMDARMPGMSGLEATREIVARHPGVRVVMFTAHADKDLLWEALDAGAQGFVLKDSDASTLIGALRQAARGEPYVDPRLAPDFLRQLPTPRSDTVLSGREREILQMLADGMSNREVAETLVVSVETVKTHVKHILAKLEAEHRTQAVAIGIRQALIR